ncbi:WD40-repeat-containing domain protein [Cryomyces antarcticus]
MSPQHQIQTSTLPPPQPTYVLRGHGTHVHGVCFLRCNTRLLTGDGDGWVVLWNIATKRAVAVWKGHDGAILGLQSWGEENIITHGRDNKLNVWQLRTSDEHSFSTVLPVDDGVSRRKQPWLLHSLSVNTLNFCCFAMCEAPSATASNEPVSASTEHKSENSLPSREPQVAGTAPKPILVAVPGTLDAQIDIFQLPLGQRISSIPAMKCTSTGMVMALRTLVLNDRVVVLTGYENGHTCVWRSRGTLSASFPQCQDLSTKWDCVYSHQAHTQPVLSLDVAVRLGCYYTSSADATLAQHPLPSSSAPPLKDKTAMEPIRTVQTKHSGQQALTVRSDERILATAGWDARVRVYSAKTMKELAVLKWHKEGCYAVAFADVNPTLSTTSANHAQTTQDCQQLLPAQGVSRYVQTMERKRNAKAQTTHWLAAGSKDGKVSLWDIY